MIFQSLPFVDKKFGRIDEVVETEQEAQLCILGVDVVIVLLLVISLVVIPV
jgi:hypothetical protein